MPQDIKYHKRTLEVLDRPPVFSPEAIEKIATFQSATGIQLPAAVSEWYSLEGTDVLLNNNRYQSTCMSLDELLPIVEQQTKSLAKPRILDWYIDPVWDKVDLILDGNDDPGIESTLVRNIKGWRFSKFLLEQIWVLTWHRPFYLIELNRLIGRFGPAHLDFLLDAFIELDRSGPSTGRDPKTGEPGTFTRFRLFESGLRISVYCFGDASRGEYEADWLVSANTIASLQDFLRRLFSTFGYMDFYYTCSILPAHDDAPLIDRMLEQFKAEFARPSRRFNNQR